MRTIYAEGGETIREFTARAKKEAANLAEGVVRGIFNEIDLIIDWTYGDHVIVGDYYNRWAALGSRGPVVSIELSLRPKGSTPAKPAYRIEDDLDARCQGQETGPKNVDGKEPEKLVPETDAEWASLAEAAGSSYMSGQQTNNALHAIAALHRQRGWGIAAAVLGASMMAGGCSSTFGLSEWPSGSILKTTSVAQSAEHDLFGRLSRQGGGGAE